MALGFPTVTIKTYRTPTVKPTQPGMDNDVRHVRHVRHARHVRHVCHVRHVRHIWQGALAGFRNMPVRRAGNFPETR